MFTLLGRLKTMREIMWELCVGDSTFIIDGALEKWGFEDILDFYGKLLLKCYYLFFSVQLLREIVSGRT
jgi:hypothetical protein